MIAVRQAISEALAVIRSGYAQSPEIGLILGSGLGSLADELKPLHGIAYSSIPHFPKSTVAGHKGMLCLGKLQGADVVAMQGRFHYYEGYSMQEITFPVRVMRELGVKTLIITNACGGINPDLYPGALMLIKDHLNLMGGNPLIGPNDDSIGPRFPDMSAAYDQDLIKLAETIAVESGIELKSGVHSAVSGPYYCSRAELRMIRTMGADTVGMSTIPETIVAVHCGMRVLGISCVTDMAIPEQLHGISHEEVVSVAEKTRPKFEKLVRGIVGRLG